MRARAVGPVVTGCVLLTWAGTAPAGAAPEHRTVTPYAVSGTPVQGSTTGCDNAPALTPGRYLDGLQQGKDLWYRVEKRPEQVLEVSATAVPPDLMYGTSSIKLGAGWAEGDDPTSWLSDLGTVEGGRASVGARSSQKADGQRSGCIHIRNTLSPMGSQAKNIPVEIALRFTDSPQPSTTTDGFSFAGARQVPADGVVKGDLALGEFPFWRVQVKDGQTLTVRTVMQHPASLSAGRLARWTVQIYDPLRSLTRCPAKTGDRSEIFVDAGSGDTRLTCGPWKVDTDLKSYESEFTVPGTYYIVPGVLGESDAGHGQVVPYEMTVTVEGAGTDRDPGAVYTKQTAQPSGGKSVPSTAGKSNGAAASSGSGGAGPGDTAVAGDASAAGATTDDDGAGTALTATAATAALVSVGAFGMHIRRRRLDGGGMGPAASGVGGAPLGVAGGAPMAVPPIPSMPPPPAPPAPPVPSVPSVPPVPPRESADTPHPGHNALDSVWSMSAIPVGTSEPDTGSAGPAVPPAAVDVPTDAGESLPGREASSPVPPTVADVVVFTPPPALFRGEDGPGADDEAPRHEAAPSWRPPTPSEEPPRGS